MNGENWLQIRISKIQALARGFLVRVTYYKSRGEFLGACEFVEKRIKAESATYFARFNFANRFRFVSR